MEVAVLNYLATDTNYIPWPSNNSTSLANSAGERVSRSTPGGA
jgi:hypothetical protein